MTQTQQMLNKARATGQTTVTVNEGTFCLYWVDGKGRTKRQRRNNPRQIWLFVPGK